MTLYIFECKCGCGSFETNKSNQKFVNSKHRDVWRQAQYQKNKPVLEQKLCKGCGCTFQPIAISQIFHSLDCSRHFFARYWVTLNVHRDEIIYEDDIAIVRIARDRVPKVQE